MKKILLLALAIVLLAACSTNKPKAPEVVEDENNAQQNEPEEQEPEKEEATNSNNEKEPEKQKYTEVDELVDLTFAIFKAQNEKDYAFLESIISKDTKLNKKTNTFTFTNASYTHEQEFRTDKNAADLEHRYTNDEDKNSVIVGFAAADYENEYNYVIDFEFILEDGSYKMNDMDINK